MAAAAGGQPRAVGRSIACGPVGGKHVKPFTNTHGTRGGPFLPLLKKLSGSENNSDRSEQTDALVPVFFIPKCDTSTWSEIQGTIRLHIDVETLLKFPRPEWYAFCTSSMIGVTRVGFARLTWLSFFQLDAMFFFFLPPSLRLCFCSLISVPLGK